MNDFSAWEDYLSRYPGAHILQTSSWGQLKSEFGWIARHIITETAGAQVLFRRLPLGFSVAYIPKGPVGQPGVDFWEKLDRLCREERAVFVKIEPDEWENSEETQNALVHPPPGFQASPHTIQPPRTIVILLDGNEDNLLSKMKQKARYNIKLALKKDVVVHASEDIQAFSKLMNVTGQRDHFEVHSQAYYQKAYELFHPRGNCELFIAEYNHAPIAGLMVFTRGWRAWYFYGASNDTHRNRMPNYLLQWEAIRWAKRQGCLEYDLWGVPDEPEEALETQFSHRSDGLWGVYRFKRGFGGQARRSAGPWDRVYRPWLYRVYQRWVGGKKAPSAAVPPPGIGEDQGDE